MAGGVVCPKCKKSNPTALEICQFCGTPLQSHDTEPLPTIRPGEMPTKQKTSELESTLPSWLRDIRSGADSEDAMAEDVDIPSVSSPAPEPEKPAPPPAPPPEPPKKKDASPLDFLAGLAQANDDEDDEPDWFASLKGDTPAAQMTPAEEPSPAAEEQPQQAVDWLAGLQEDAPSEKPSSEQPAAADWTFDEDAGEPAAQETPDWLETLKAQDTSAGAPSEAGEFSEAGEIESSGDLPDWLETLKAQDTSASTPAQPVEPSPAGEIESSGDLPNWLDQLEAAAPAAAPETPSAPADSFSDGDLPGWLAAMAPDDSAAALSPAAETPAVTPMSPEEDQSSVSDLPDWMASLAASDTPPAAQPAPVASNESGDSSGDLPDWLAGLTGDSPKAQADAPVDEHAPVDEGTLPGWLDTATEEKAPEKPAAPQSNATKAFSTGALEELTSLNKGNEVPDWMAGLGTPTPAQASEPAAPTEASGADNLDWLSGLGQAGEGSVATESEPTGQPESAEEKPQEEPVSFDASTPNAAASPPFADSAQNLDSILSMEMPDWLSGFAPSEQEPAKAQSEQPGPSDENLRPADLPSWVQAMRPIESVVAGVEGEDEDQTIEQAGPLAGFHSLLPVQSGVLGVQKPKPYLIKLQVDPNQMAQATLLENLIASEAESRPVSTAKQAVSIRGMRWVIGLVLLLATLLPATLASTPHLFPLPDQGTRSGSEVGKFYDLVEGLPDTAATLVVFDYQPAYAGEMQQAAGAVMAHLMSKNARLAFVSTLPTGVLMNELLIAAQNKPRTDSDQYHNGIQYADLGYLPGDAAGIQVFAQNPSVLGTDYQRGNLWSPIPGFDKNEKKLSDFAAAIVLTDNPDTGRIWIEQAGPSLGSKPLLMVVSAQAAPMIRPYFESGQVQGMVSGLTGGALYETIAQHPDGNAGVYWDSYGAGMIAAELLIVVGGVWSLIQRLQTRRATQEEEEDET